MSPSSYCIARLMVFFWSELRARFILFRVHCASNTIQAYFEITRSKRDFSTTRPRLLGCAATNKLVTMIIMRSPPGPRGRRFVGCLPELRRDFVGFVTACVRDYGDIVS